ncbi:MAG TPA: RIP metalloprotease RseP [Terriglobia bacterium]|nr:RIP metalloprotease RseP [Terriglobia bacterium]
MGILRQLFAAALVLGVVIILHELGHFLVARFFKIRIDTFSVGFGPRLFGFRRGDTDYRISAFPLGGYVKMAGDTPSEDLTGEPHEFLSKPKWQRFLVASAGPIMNMILAVVLLSGLFMYGREIPEVLTTQASIGDMEQGSPADQAGIRKGDRISELAGKQKPNWQDVEALVALNSGKALPIVLDRNGETISTTVTPIKKGPSERGYVGMGPYLPVIVKSVWPDQSAQLLPGDEVTIVNGIDLKTSAQSLQNIIQAIPEPNFPIMVNRHGETMHFQITPVVKDGLKYIGLDRDLRFPGPTVKIKLPFSEAVSKSVSTNVEYGKTIFQIVGMLFKREASLKQLDGPIGIVRASGEALEEGFATLINLMALISLNLGLLNILPIPVLDGGVMLMLIVESLMGRDMSLRLKERINFVSVIALLMLTVMVVYNDIIKMIPTSPPAP